MTSLGSPIPPRTLKLAILDVTKLIAPLISGIDTLFSLGSSKSLEPRVILLT